MAWMLTPWSLLAEKRLFCFQSSQYIKSLKTATANGCATSFYRNKYLLKLLGFHGLIFIYEVKAVLQKTKIKKNTLFDTTTLTLMSVACSAISFIS